MTWRGLEMAAPDLARKGEERLDQMRVALLATVRRDGSPRISAVEPYLGRGHLLFGSMSGSRKTRDLLRDPRCALHSAITGQDTGDGELQLYGRALEVAADIRGRCTEGWWHRQPPGTATVFELDVEQASFIDWDLAHGQMTVQRWSARDGLTKTTRGYP